MQSLKFENKVCLHCLLRVVCSIVNGISYRIWMLSQENEWKEELQMSEYTFEFFLAVQLDQAQNGGDATTQHVVDRGSVPKEGSRCLMSMSPDSDVHLRLCFLPYEE